MPSNETPLLGHCGSDDEHVAHVWELAGRPRHCIGTTAEYAHRPRGSLRPYRRLEPPLVVWGSTMCTRRHCVRLAEVKIDEWPFCIECGDDELERALAFELAPAMVRTALPGLDDR